MKRQRFASWTKEGEIAVENGRKQAGQQLIVYNVHLANYQSGEMACTGDDTALARTCFVRAAINPTEYLNG